MGSSSNLLHYQNKNSILRKCEKLFPFMLAKLVSKWVMPVGNFTAWNMVFSQTVKCHLTRPLVVVMIHSTPFSLKLVLANMSHVPFSLIWNQLLLMKSALVHTDNFSTQNNSSLVKKMLPTTTPEVTTPLVKKSSN